ncbi:hypothetical protein GA0074695_3209 [Micromonospora viridifaciens]|uniref:Uncharacterized protein n=1 Tax=Micromonospora viridifaciens TaxID=1881 RepID=A0A1C4XDG1_MICVI|nr:hypothetical protein [Micromonospora viridifaciens]SCF06427.1 hypothetical protein GA0074695_3209 [Micromonospora viridifaciens]
MPATSAGRAARRPAPQYPVFCTAFEGGQTAPDEETAKRLGRQKTAKRLGRQGTAVRLGREETAVRVGRDEPWPAFGMRAMVSRMQDGHSIRRVGERCPLPVLALLAVLLVVWAAARAIGLCIVFRLGRRAVPGCVPEWSADRAPPRQAVPA